MSTRIVKFLMKTGTDSSNADTAKYKCFYVIGTIMQKCIWTKAQVTHHLVSKFACSKSQN